MGECVPKANFSLPYTVINSPKLEIDLPEVSITIDAFLRSSVSLLFNSVLLDTFRIRYFASGTALTIGRISFSDHSFGISSHELTLLSTIRRERDTGRPRSRTRFTRSMHAGFVN